MGEEWRLLFIQRLQLPTFDAQSSQSSHLFGECLVQNISLGLHFIKIAVFYHAGNKGLKRSTGHWAMRHGTLGYVVQGFGLRGMGLWATWYRSLGNEIQVFGQPSPFGRICNPSAKGIGICNPAIHRQCRSEVLLT